MAKGRKILFFLGAGASYAAGAYAQVEGGGRILIPTQANLWETFLRFCHKPGNRKKIESFLFRYFKGYDRVPSRSTPQARRKLLNDIDVEEAFTFLSERAEAPSTSPQLRAYASEVWKALVDETGTVFSRFAANVATRKTYRTLLDRHIRSRDVVVSFNYDTVFESSLPGNFDWVYHGLEERNKALRVLKPHGSVNWAITDNGISVQVKPELSVVVAPTHLKFVQIGQAEKATSQINGYLNQATEIKEIWAEMERQMRQSKVLVFIGYSFPVADLYFSSVLRSVLSVRETTPGIVIVNPDAVAIEKRLRARFPIQKVGRYFDMATFLQSQRKDVLKHVE